MISASGLAGRRVLVTGATGYVASRLIPALVVGGARVRATSRHPDPVAARFPGIEVMASDLLEESSLLPPLEGVDVVFYLVHSMTGSDFEERDRRAALNLLHAAERAGVERIVYLSGLGSADDALSAHLRSRQEVGELLASGSIPVTELRAAIVIGSGSVAFDMLRYLTERLPAMIAPRWLATRIQPISEDDLVAYLIAAAAENEPGGVVEIGGTDIVTYKQMIQGYSRARGLRRLIVSVPVLSPRLSSYWVNLITPVPASIARPLIDGLRNEVVVKDAAARTRYPDIDPVGYEEAVSIALDSQSRLLREAQIDGSPEAPGTRIGILEDERDVPIDGPAHELGRHLRALGGDPSWYPVKWAWWIRARLDDLFGGTGLSWHRPEDGLQPGSRVDWWTVEDVSDDAIYLRAEMKTPGEAWVAWRVSPSSPRPELHQGAFFRPRGLLGRLYWWALYPFHVTIFKLMATRLAQRVKPSP